jgi:hypothetical protein
MGTNWTVAMSPGALRKRILVRAAGKGELMRAEEAIEDRDL